MGSPLNWDSNNNGIMGDINSELNFNQDDIYISRCPARTKAQVKDFVDLVLTYEKNPPSLWGNKVLFCGQYVHYMTNHVSDVDTIGQIMIQESIKPYWNGKVDYLFDSRTNLSEFQESAGEGSGHISSNRVATLLNRNYSLVHEYTHGKLAAVHFLSILLLPTASIPYIPKSFSQKLVTQVDSTGMKAPMNRL